MAVETVGRMSRPPATGTARPVRKLAQGPARPVRVRSGTTPSPAGGQVTHGGICHTDSAMVDSDYGFTQYLLVPGHEVIGVVAAAGTEVDRLRVAES